MPSPELVEFWDVVHEIQNARCLNTSLSSTEQWEMFEVNDFFAPKKRILYIGSGAGESVIDLASKNMKVSVLEVSQYAEAAIKGYFERFYLDAADLPNNTFDLVLSRLVAQHMNDEDLAYQVLHVTKAMKKEAVFAMQFYLLRDGQTALLPDLSNDDLDAQRSGHVGRTKDVMQAIIEGNGGKILEWKKTIHHDNLPGQPIWQFVHIGKA